MLHSTSIKTRFLVSAGSNAIRAIIGFASGLLVARGLSPSGYGDLMFLLGSFVAIRSLLDMGSSSAFYTFLSRHTQGIRFFSFYFFWLALQFVITLLSVALIIPDSIFEKVWLGHNREIVVFAFFAAFMQQQVWQTVSQIGESMRKTVKVQLLNLAIAIIYLAVVSTLLVMGSMSVDKMLLLMIIQYAVATLLAFRFLRRAQTVAVEKDASIKQISREYWVYCKPLIVLSMISFLYDFADKWMLQRFGGSAQQGYFQIASQFAAISLLATTSILNIFWKEIADAWAKHDQARVAMLYRKVNRGLVMLGAITTGLLLPWSEQIVTIFLGQAYAQAWPVLAIMLLYPIHQSMGQIGGTMLLASGQTHKYMSVSILIMMLSIPTTYIVLAPASHGWLPGMGLGAFGLACKMVVLGMASVNIQAWVIARYGEWQFDWVFQVVGIPLMIGLGFVAKLLVGVLWNLEEVGVTNLLVPVTIAGFFYLAMVIMMIWRFSWLIGAERSEIENMVKRVMSRKM